MRAPSLTSWLASRSSIDPAVNCVTTLMDADTGDGTDTSYILFAGATVSNVQATNSYPTAVPNVDSAEARSVIAPASSINRTCD